jgi:hypothetical protein
VLSVVLTQPGTVVGSPSEPVGAFASFSTQWTHTAAEQVAAAGTEYFGSPVCETSPSVGRIRIRRAARRSRSVGRSGRRIASSRSTTVASGAASGVAASGEGPLAPSKT